MCAVVSVARESIQLPNQHDIEQPLFAVVDHALELRTIRRSGGQRAVNVAGQNRQVIAHSIFGTLSYLALDALLALIVRGVSGVDDGFRRIHHLPIEGIMIVSGVLRLIVVHGDPQQHFLQLRIGRRTGLKAHFDEAAHVLAFRRVSRPVLVELSLRLIRATEDVIEGHIEEIGISAQKCKRRLRLIVLEAVDIGLLGIQKLGNLCLG